MQYLLTGSTGLIGRHVMFELLKDMMDRKQNSKLWLVVRPKGEKSARQRIADIFNDPESPDYIRQYSVDKLMSKLGFIEHHLNSAALRTELKELPADELIVIHNAASTNLMPGEAAEQDVQQNNHQATHNLLESLPAEKVKRFAFVSTAFSCGTQSGGDSIPTDFSQLEKSSFRNPYEKCKAQTEEFLSDYCEQKNIDLQILRPAVVCGRLIDAPYYCTTKFDVFYGWAKFFYKMKNKLGDNPMRIHVNSQGTLNIVPVDYVSKVIFSAVHHDEIRHINIVNPKAPMHKDYISVMLKQLGITNYQFTDQEPEQPSMMEKMYYSTAGKAFAPYITTEDQVFETSLLDQHFKDLGYSNILSKFDKLIDYAIGKRFA